MLSVKNCPVLTSLVHNLNGVVSFLELNGTALGPNLPIPDSSILTDLIIADSLATAISLPHSPKLLRLHVVSNRVLTSLDVSAISNQGLKTVYVLRITDSQCSFKV